MNEPRERNPSREQPADAPAQQPASRPEDLQPPATGANRGSPATPAMKEFQKTPSESSGR